MKRINKLLNKIIVILIISIIGIYGKNYINESYSYKEPTNEIKDNSLLNIYYLNVGQADSILINNNDDTMLIDAGNNSDGDNIVDFIKELKIKDIDILVGTHPHEDHIGGLDNIINNFDIGKIYMPDATTNTKTFEDVIDRIEEKEYNINIPEIDEKFNLGNMKFKVIYTGTDESDLNNTSIVLKMTFGNTSYLFTGDATSVTEEKILNKDIKADVLKVGHHGSSYSTTDEFLSNVNPKYGIISVGKDNKYNHPSDKTIKRLKENNIETYRTDINGTIKLTSNGDYIKIEKLNINLDGE